MADSIADPINAPVPGDFRRPVYTAGVKLDTVNSVAELKKIWLKSPTADAKEAVLVALGHTPDVSIISSVLLPFFINTHPPAPAEDCINPSDMFMLSASFAENPVARPLLWAFLRDNWDKLLAKLGGNLTIVDRVLASALPKFASYETLADIEKFFDSIDTTGFDRTLRKGKDRIRSRAAYRERDAKGLAEWLEQNGY